MDLSAPGSVHGFAGSATDLAGGFDNMTAVVGGSANDTLNGANADATWTFTTSAFTYTSGGESDNLLGKDPFLPDVQLVTDSHLNRLEGQVGE